MCEVVWTSFALACCDCIIALFLSVLSSCRGDVRPLSTNAKDAGAGPYWIRPGTAKACPDHDVELSLTIVPRGRLMPDLDDIGNLWPVGPELAEDSGARTAIVVAAPRRAALRCCDVGVSPWVGESC